jgi:protein arginine kinase activator
MQCDRCGKNPAVIHLTQIENNEMSTFHLCDACAAEKGLGTGATAETAPLTDFLAQMGKGLGGGAPSSVGACEFCELTLNDFKRTGRLGCPHCYAHFDQHLRGLLRKLHGGTQHVGKVYLPPDPRESDRTAKAAGLRRSLARAVEAEDFERAAALRDQIRRLEAAEQGGER